MCRLKHHTGRQTAVAIHELLFEQFVKAYAIKADIQQGIDPVLQRAANRSALIRQQSKAATFEQLARLYVERKGKEFKSG